MLLYLPVKVDIKIMFKKVKLILIILLIPCINVFAKDNKSRLSLGGGIYNFMKHGSDGFNQSSTAYNIELFSGRKMANVIRPLLDFWGPDESAYYAYLGFPLIYIFLIANVLFCLPA